MRSRSDLDGALELRVAGADSSPRVEVRSGVFSLETPVEAPFVALTRAEFDGRPAFVPAEDLERLFPKRIALPRDGAELFAEWSVSADSSRRPDRSRWRAREPPRARRAFGANTDDRIGPPRRAPHDPGFPAARRLRTSRAVRDPTAFPVRRSLHRHVAGRRRSSRLASRVARDRRRPDAVHDRGVRLQEGPSGRLHRVDETSARLRVDEVQGRSRTRRDDPATPRKAAEFDPRGGRFRFEAGAAAIALRALIPETPTDPWAAIPEGFWKPESGVALPRVFPLVPDRNELRLAVTRMCRIEVRSRTRAGWSLLRRVARSCCRFEGAAVPRLGTSESSATEWCAGSLIPIT